MPAASFWRLRFIHRHESSDEGGDASVRAAAVLVTKRVQKRAKIVGAAVRTAHMLSIGMAGVIDETPLSYDGDKLVLTIPQAYAGLDGERLRRRFEQLAAARWQDGRDYELAVNRVVPLAAHALSQLAVNC